MAILKAEGLDIISYGVEQTRRLGARLGALLQPGDIICLSGEMGAGKTVFAKGIGQGWGATTLLTSPTFNLVHTHRREKDPQRLYHLDCYRLTRASDSETIGLNDLLDERATLVLEWPENIEAVLPKERLWINLQVLEETRRNFIFEGCGERYIELIAQFKEVSYGI